MKPRSTVRRATTGTLVKCWDQLAYAQGGYFNFRFVSWKGDELVVSELGDDEKFRQFLPSQLDCIIDKEPAR